MGAKISFDTLASAIRELRKKIPIVPFETSTCEESISLSIQRSVNPEEWGVTTIESWSKTYRRALSAEDMWNEKIAFIGNGSKGVKVSFNYFMDGIQRTIPIGKINFRKSSYETVPIHFGQIAIVLLRREHRMLMMEDEEVELLIEYPNNFVMSETNRKELQEDLLKNVKEKMGGGIQTVDTSYRIARLRESEEDSTDNVRVLDGIKYPGIDKKELWKWCSDPAQFRSQARRWTTRYRDIAEQEIYDKALERFGSGVTVGSKYELVVKDGPLTHIRGGLVKAALGIVKTFRTNFLGRTKMTRVLGLPYGCRSPVFSKTRPNGDPEECEIYDDCGAEKNRLISWYVRIREIGRHDPTWGLVRLEMHEETLPCQGHSGRWTEEDTLVVDEISRQLCSEGNPTSHPDPRWHNLIYPIKCCESFARSRVIPHVTARYILGGS